MFHPQCSKLWIAFGAISGHHGNALPLLQQTYEFLIAASVGKNTGIYAGRTEDFIPRGAKFQYKCCRSLHPLLDHRCMSSNSVKDDQRSKQEALEACSDLHSMYFDAQTVHTSVVSLLQPV